VDSVTSYGLALIAWREGQKATGEASNQFIRPVENDPREKLRVGSENLEANPVGMLLLYEYLHSQRPAACSASVVERVH